MCTQRRPREKSRGLRLLQPLRSGLSGEAAGEPRQSLRQVLPLELAFDHVVLRNPFRIGLDGERREGAWPRPVLVRESGFDPRQGERKSVVLGTSVSERVDLCGRRMKK